MIQRFIELGEGYSDLFELLEIVQANQHRLARMLAFHAVKDGKDVTSLAVILEPTKSGDFQPIYFCREGIANPHVTPNKRYDLFVEAAQSQNKDIIELVIKPSNEFADKELFYQYLIGILRMNRYLPVMSTSW
ncbi:DUF7147 family protein [Bacillus marasmi]|uniref:DUF7147 family protein n=1 Tax=Bacillus marasmi TaxID=1926279 RepID=UPI0011C83D4D|nr:methylthioribose kinase [Bacillus marasmi]